MFIKKTVKNQIVIPKVLLRRANLDGKDIPFFDIQYKEGGFFLRPMRAESLDPKDAFLNLLDDFEKRAKKQGLTEIDVQREVRAYRRGK